MTRQEISDEVWAVMEPLMPTVTGRSRPWTDHRLAIEGMAWKYRTGAPWRDLPEEFGKWSSVYRQFRRWTLAGLWEQILEVLTESRIVPDALQMVDSTVVRAHHQAAGAKGGLRDRVLAVRKVVSRPRSTFA